MKTVYKIIFANGKTLFRAIEGSRKIKFNKWLKATKRMVRDKYPDGKEYLSGIHVFLDRQTAEKYLERFRTEKERIIVECKVKGLRKKPTNSPVYLADEIFITRNEQ